MSAAGNIVAIPIAGATRENDPARVQITAMNYVNTDLITRITIDGSIYIHFAGGAPLEIEANWLPAGWTFERIIDALEWDAEPKHPPDYWRAVKDEQFQRDRDPAL